MNWMTPLFLGALLLNLIIEIWLNIKNQFHIGKNREQVPTDFAEVVRARIADLNARIDALEIEVELLKTNIQLNYFFSEQSLKAVSEFGANQ